MVISPKIFGKKTESIGSLRNNRDQPDNSMVKIDGNTQKSLEDLRRLACKRSPNNTGVKSSQGMKYMDEGRTSTNGSENKKTNDDA